MDFHSTTFSIYIFNQINFFLMEPLKIYLRIKRENRVFFFESSLLDPVELLKRKLLPYYK